MTTRATRQQVVDAIAAARSACRAAIDFEETHDANVQSLRNARLAIQRSSPKAKRVALQVVEVAFQDSLARMEILNEKISAEQDVLRALLGDLYDCETPYDVLLEQFDRAQHVAAGAPELLALAL